MQSMEIVPRLPCPMPRPLWDGPGVLLKRSNEKFIAFSFLTFCSTLFSLFFSLYLSFCSSIFLSISISLSPICLYSSLSPNFYPLLSLNICHSFSLSIFPLYNNFIFTFKKTVAETFRSLHNVYINQSHSFRAKLKRPRSTNPSLA
mgnify:CR=1 FL=1